MARILLAAVRTPQRDRLLAGGLAALAFALAVWQRPGIASADTKIDLHVDPLRFLAGVGSAWSATEDLGHVQGGQYGGYLFPMGPFFALGRALGVAPWLVQRLWLGALLAAAAWGTLRLLDALRGRPRGVAHAVAGLLVILNPYVTVFSARTSVTLLGYAALPWLLLCVHRGVRAPRSWWWPAACALALTCTGGGVNAAVTAWLLLGPVALALYERAACGVAWRALAGFGSRAALLSALASAWWVAPLLVQARFGVDFLRFTEQPGTIWSTTSLPESLRGMGYWISYLGVGYGGTLRPLFGDGGVLVFSAPLVVAGQLVPALALTGFAWSWRWRYGPFFLGLALAGALAMTAGFPEGTPLRRAMYFTYNHVAPLQFLRTTYKAGPLLVLSVACLAGATAAALPRRWRLPAAGALAALAAVSAWPLVRGQAIDSQLTFARIPPAWRSAAAHVDARAGERTRAVVLPGQLYAYYRWGGTVDAILPRLARRPVAVRYAVPYADLRGADLLWTVDALVQQRRALPGQLPPLLDLLGAGVVVAGADDDRSRSGAAPAADAADALDQLGAPSASWGPVRRAPRAAGTPGAARALPEVRAWDRPAARPLVRVEADAGATVVDGSAEGLAALAAFPGALPRGRIAYAADAAPREIRPAAAVVFTDSNRRRVFAAARMSQNLGATLAADEPFSPDAAVLDPFPAAGAAAETVAVLDGVARLRSPSSPAFPQFPERRPLAALDGNPATHWQADRALDAGRHWMEVGFKRPRDVDHVDLWPYSDRRGRVTAVEVAGRRFATHPGWNRLRLGLRRVRSLRVRIAAVSRPPHGARGAGGLRELRIPEVRAREALRGPVLAERALAGRDVRRTALTYVFARTTGDDPFRREPRTGSADAALVRDRGDGEPGLERLLAPPAARRWTVDAWVTVAPHARDSALDALAGMRAAPVLDSSGRWSGRPGYRASSAFDGTARAWIGSWLPGRGAWLRWELRRPATVRALRIVPARERVRRPSVVRLHSDGAASPPLRVPRGGVVRLPAPARGRAFRLDVLRAAFPPGSSGFVRQRRAVGIAELRGRGVPRVRVARGGSLDAPCGALTGTVGGRALALRPQGRLADLDAGRPLRARGCAPVALPAGAARLELPARTFAPYLLRLRSPAPLPPPRARSPGRVIDAGRAARDARHGIRLALSRPGWLVLGQAYSPAWRGRCDGRDLGAPRPVDGFAMGWRVPATCRVADLAFAADGMLRVAYGVSLLAVLGALVLVLSRRPPAPDGAPARPPAAPGEAPPRRPPRQAAAAALLAGGALGFVFAARATPLFALVVYAVLRRGIGVRALTAAAAPLLLLAVPVLTLSPGGDRGGYDPQYAIERIAAHWAAVAAVTLLLLALARALSTATARPAAVRAPARAAAAEPAAAP